MAFVILDNSLLQVFTTLERLDLLGHHKPLRIAPCVREEHARRAPHPAERYLAARLKDGLVTVPKPKFTDAASTLFHAYEPILGHCDAYGLAWASIDRESFFLSDDRDLLNACEREGVNAVDLSAVLIALKKGGQQTDQLRRIVHDIETKADHAVQGWVKKALRL